VLRIIITTATTPGGMVFPGMQPTNAYKPSAQLL
jgi:hypothetical protein